MKKGNPFTLTFGKQPSEYIERYEAKDTVVSTFEDDRPVSQTFLIEGIRGSGKTVLMTSIARELGDRDDWITVNLNSTQDLLTELSVKLHEKCRSMPDLLKSGFSVSVAGFGIGLNADNSAQNYTAAIESLLHSLKKKQKRVLITIDEVMNNPGMRHFASEFQLYVREDYPVFLLMTGLYENIWAIQNDPSLTFLLRSPKIHMEPLSIARITKVYASVFQTDRSRANHLAVLTNGYAFAFQALGRLCYEYQDSLPMEEILSKLDDMLDDFVYKKVWESLSLQERNIVKNLSSKPVKVKEICTRLSMSSGTFSKYRERLLKKGVVLAPQHGYLTLVLPRFEIFTQAMGENESEINSSF